MSRGSRYTFFASCAPGVEPVLYAEARELRLAKAEQQVGGVRFEGRIEDAWKANLHLRTAVRVFLRLARVPAPDGDALYRGVSDIDWRRFLSPRSTFVVAAHTRDSQLDHSLFIEQRTKDAIVDQFAAREGERPSVDKDDPNVYIHVHLWRDRCTISVDTAGSSLHKRGWRVFQGRAPLAETLAAAVVLHSGWDRRAPLIDPFCGSGTILIEAALIAARVPPGVFRESFGFERFPDHDASSWEKMRDRALEELTPPRRLTLIGSDVSEEAIQGARKNVASAGLEGQIELEVRDALEMDFRSGWNGWIVTNPPYGERVGPGEDLPTLYRRLGERLRERCGGYRLALLCGNERLSKALRVGRPEVTELHNGSIQCELLCVEVPRQLEGSE